jgi:uncharacterized membrane protein YidH (DUF202 family)
MMTSRDLGLQAERTLLAWRRTALGLLANAALLVAGGEPVGLRLALGVVVSALALGCWAAVSAVYRGSLQPEALGSVRAIRLITLVVVGVGLVDCYIVITR